MNYTTTRNDLSTFLEIDAFWRPATTAAELIAALESDNWQVQQAALSAIGDRREMTALAAVAALLETQDGLGVYACPDEWDWDAAADEAEKETWRCRFRVKQAALVAIGKCVEKNGPEIVSETLFQRIREYAVSREDDYPVRVAACEVLGGLGRPAAQETLRQAATDGETCTAMTARKAISRLAEESG